MEIAGMMFARDLDSPGPLADVKIADGLSTMINEPKILNQFEVTNARVSVVRLAPMETCARTLWF